MFRSMVGNQSVTLWWAGIVLGCTVVAADAVGANQQPSNRFRMIRNGSEIDTQDYNIQRSADGYLVTGDLRLTEPGEPAKEMKLEQMLEPDLTLRQYKLAGTVGGDLASIDAITAGDQIRVTLILATGPGQFLKMDDRLPLAPHTGLRKDRLPHFRYHLSYRRLDKAIQDSRYPEQTNPALRLVYFLSPDRQRFVPSFQ